MKIELWVIAETNEAYLKEGIEVYKKRLKRYVPFEIVVFQTPKKVKKPDDLKRLESELILGKLESNDRLILLDENGKDFKSRAYAQWLQKQMNLGPKRLIFVVGGAFGFTDELKSKADGMLSLSKMTFSHQMIRLFFVEQLYRAFSILNNEPYHND